MIKVTKNRVLVKVIDENGEVKADAVMRADVLAIGPNVKSINVKDSVIFAPYGIDEVVIDGIKMIIINEELILATYEKGITNKKAQK